MIKLMIVEDEALERKALKFLVDKYFKDTIQVVCESSNGKDAVEKAFVHRPDLIFMDIAMPIMNGIQAASVIKQRLKDTQIIILTAYSSFEYAKASIHIGICDYLLKPISNDEFYDTVNGTIKKIKQIRKHKTYQNEIKNQLLHFMPFVEKEVVLKMIYEGQMPLKDYNNLKKMLGINQNIFMCMIFHEDTRKSAITESFIASVKNKLKFLVGQVIGYYYLNDMIFILFDDKLETIVQTKAFEELIKEIKQYAYKHHQISLSEGLGCVYQNHENLYLSYEEAKKALRKTQVYKNIDPYPYDKESILCGKIINEDIKGALETMNEIFDYLLKNNQMSIENFQKQLKELVWMVNRNMIQFFNIHFQFFMFEEMEQKIYNTFEITKLRDYMHQLIKELIFSISHYKQDRSVKAIEGVKKYIEQNYMKNISLHEVADYIELSSNYLCKLFKKVETINFKDYLIKIRMEKAKQILLEGKKTIKEVAREVGYQDPNYFSRAFKKYVGKSASDYAKFSSF